MELTVAFPHSIFLLNLINLLSTTGKVPGTNWQVILARIVANVPAFDLPPRFIISIREMYAHDVRRGGIDTGFGLSTISSRGDTARGPMVFAAGVQSEVGNNVELQNEGAENVEADDGQNEGRGDVEEVVRLA